MTKEKVLVRLAESRQALHQAIENYLAWNDEQAARKRDVPLEVILDELATVRQGIVEAASRLSASR